MEFGEKLQSLRKQKGLTQEELAQALYVSRTAISKWESGRGYPSIDSLKAIARFFGVTIDHLLSGEEALTIAQEDHTQKEQHFRALLFALLDLSCVLFLTLPLFGQQTAEGAWAVPLPALTGVQPYVKAACWTVVLAAALWGIAGLVLQNCWHPAWMKNQTRVSFLIGAGGIFLFTLSRQPYAAAFAFAILLLKAWIFHQKRH